MIDTGTKVKIKVNYLSELDPDIEPLWEVTITDVDLNDELCYYVEELDLWFSESDVEIIKK